MRGRTQALEALFARLEGIPDKSTNAAEIRGTAAVAGRKGVLEYTPIFGTSLSRVRHKGRKRGDLMKGYEVRWAQAS
jgi:hypothetical protein